MKFTILHNSGGFHGHQLKDYFGAMATAKIMDMEYYYTPYTYLERFALNDDQRRISKANQYLSFFQHRITGPFWDGFEDYEEFRKVIDAKINGVSPRKIAVFEKAFRVHPWQTIKWYKEGLIGKDIFSEIVTETTNKFRSRYGNPRGEEGSPLEVAIHISRGGDYNPEKFPEHFSYTYNVRFMFDLDYFLRIYEQIKQAFYGRAVHFSLYTESKNSAEIQTAFANKPDVTLKIGCNRHKPDEDLIFGIFRSFVEADILVSCNSSFSTMALYFRGNKPTIYHPHRHMDNLPDWPYLKTDDKGCFSTERLTSML